MLFDVVKGEALQYVDGALYTPKWTSRLEIQTEPSEEGHCDIEIVLASKCKITEGKRFPVWSWNLVQAVMTWCMDGTALLMCAVKRVVDDEHVVTLRARVPGDVLKQYNTRTLDEYKRLKQEEADREEAERLRLAAK